MAGSRQGSSSPARRCSRFSLFLLGWATRLDCPSSLSFSLRMSYHPVLIRLAPRQNPIELRQKRRDMFAVLLALGLDDPTAGAVIFHQDQVPEHAELAWYLNCVTPVNRLQRMTSWKVSALRLSRHSLPVLTTPALSLVKTGRDTECKLGRRNRQLAVAARIVCVSCASSCRRIALSVSLSCR